MLTQNNSDDAAISIKNISKTYVHKGKKVQALKPLNLNIPKGSIFGILGQNGAGKSTLINIISGLVNEDSGDIKIWGHCSKKEKRKARQKIGVVTQELTIDPFFSPQEALEHHAGLYGVPKAARQTKEILTALHLYDKRMAYARTLSGGMKRRLMVAKALVHRPPVLILDEPTVGMDVTIRQILWAYIRELNEQGTTIILTTHYLHEAEALCNLIAIMDGGEIIACASPEELKQQHDKKRLHITFSSEIPQDFLSDVPNIETLRKNHNSLMISYTPLEEKTEEIFKAITVANLSIQNIETDQANLEDVFLHRIK